eukprot:CAMPEP_0172886854 /NCGR_PEP_ID=MMETSP1075-20121228/132223_1 /TAXON_ID=2916 /ORGANISM="Ceratium fusus, Strain PA161109" /LENGTH=443 /DNA_ID=CAMNT_0013740427 /DNA_START=1 /DNA_END=1332 /DNA_ORIENTATION=-
MGCIHSARKAVLSTSPSPKGKLPRPQKVSCSSEATRSLLPVDSVACCPASNRERWLRPRWPTICTWFANGYSELVNAVIRPPRAEYSLSELGPIALTWGRRHFVRSDFHIPGANGFRLACSWWQPIPADHITEQLPCVIYMHGNSSCRIEALDALQLALQMGISLLAFDFAGCGQSEGDNITLGYQEKEDLQHVISYLRSSGVVSTIALWGRSMGAATALLHGHRDPSIAAMILDSPFSSLLQLAHEVIDRAKVRHKPKFMVNSAIKMVRSTILKKTGLDISRLRPIENVSSCHIPAIFVAGVHDTFIPPHHTADIYKQYAGEKKLIMVPGGHNSQRPAEFVESVSDFLHQTLCDPAGVGVTGLLVTSGRQPFTPHAQVMVHADSTTNIHCPTENDDDLKEDQDGVSLPASHSQQCFNETCVGATAWDVDANRGTAGSSSIAA